MVNFPRVKQKLFEMGNLLYDKSPGGYRYLYRLYKNFTDKSERDFIRCSVGPGMTIIDIGANIGEYSLFLAALVGSTGRVIAVEPEPENFGRLRRALSHLACVELIHAAASSRRGKLHLFLSEKLNVDHHTYDDGEGRSCLQVEAIALDDYVQIGTRVDFIKIDVQGAELAALKGAERILRENYHIKVLFEYWPYGLRRAGHEPWELISYLQSLGFEIHPINTGSANWQCIGNTKHHYCNLLAKRS
jgi:FkbM family methyltransferase